MRAFRDYTTVKVKQLLQLFAREGAAMRAFENGVELP
jgi:hypothetical protein